MSDVSTEFDYNPITIVSQDDDTVNFTITNPFGENVVAMYYQYAAVRSGSVKCFSEAPFTSCPEPVEVTAHCLTSAQNSLAIVDIWFVDPVVVDSSDKFSVPDCCVPDVNQTSIPTVQYSFKVYCESKCVKVIPGDKRTLSVHGESAGKTANRFELVAEEEGIMADPLLKNNKQQEQGHFCSSLDYPCGLDNEKMVNVCHYSSKDGYQTYCVPEPDSDVIAYVPKDYCGPCVGGYGGDSTTYRN